jgi:hypothetical protein
MAVDEWLPPFHFKELHLLPRTIFVLGGVVFVAACISKQWVVTLLGAGAVLFGVALNYFIVIFKLGYEERKWGLWVDLIIALALSAACVCVAFMVYF